MKTPTHKEVARRAQQLWQDYGSPGGRDDEIWFEAERQLRAGTSAGGSGVDTARIKGDAASECAVEHFISPALPEEQAIKAAVTNKETAASRRSRKKKYGIEQPTSGKLG